MMKALRPAKLKRPPQMGTFSSHSHPLVKFVWSEIIDRKLELSSVADAAGIDRSTLHKWRKSLKGPYLMQLDEVLQVLGYELSVTERADKNRAHGDMK